MRRRLRAGERAGRVVRSGRAWAADYAWIVRAQVAARRRHDDQAWADPDPERDRVPVLLLPGIWETWPVLTDLGQYLHAAGHPVHVVPQLGNNAGPVPLAARIVERRLTHLGLRRVVLVAHSKGGLIGKAVLGGPLAERIAGLVAVNAPFAGARYASWFPSRPVRALAPRPVVIRELAAVTDRHAETVSISVQFDPHLPEGHHLPGATNVRLPVAGHFRVLSHPAVLAEVQAQVVRLAGQG